MIREINEDFTLRVVESETTFSKKITDKVDQIWDERRASSHKLLYDGEIFQVLEMSESGLKGQFIPYRFFYAAHKEPKLFAKEPLTIASVTGVTAADGKFLLARRASDVTQDPLKWEFAPAGGISPDFLMENDIVDYQMQVLEELEEEVGIDLGSATSVFPFLLVQEEGSPIIEICTWIDVSEKKVEIEDLGTGEYIDFKWLTYEDLLPFIERNEITSITKDIAKHLD